MSAASRASLSRTLRHARSLARVALLGLLGLADPRASHAAPAMTGPAPALPVRFEPNRGQLDPRVRFLARGRGHALFLTDQGATIALLRSRGTDHGAPAFDEAAVALRLRGGRALAPVATSPVAGAVSHFVGRDPRRWAAAVESYARVAYACVRPGVDLVFHAADQRRLEYDVLLAPGVEPGEVVLDFTGAALSLDDAGALLDLGGGFRLRQPPPVAYQEDGRGGRTFVDARYVARADGGLGFAVGRHDRTRALVIDPVLVYATYLGGSSDDAATAVAMDAAGDTYVTGYTASPDFPIAGVALPHAGNVDVFVTRVRSSGNGLVYSSYLGGSGTDVGLAIAVDASGSAYVTGYTYSADFPTTSAAQPGLAGGADAFVVKLAPGGTTLSYATYLGGADDDLGQGIAVDGSGRAHVTGQTLSPGFPHTVGVLQPALGGDRDAFVTRLNASGNLLLYSTFLGGGDPDLGQAIAVDASGNAYVAGYTFSTDFPTHAALQATGAAGFFADAFVSKINAAGSALVYSTYLGGSADDQAYGLAVDGRGAVTVAGYTRSTNFPTAAALMPAFRGGATDAFVSRLDPTGAALVFSSYVGGSGDDLAYAVAVDGTGTSWLTGYTTSGNFPTTAKATQPALAGAYDGFLLGVGPTGAPLVHGTYLGGHGDDFGLSLAATGTLVQVAGQTTSTDFPTTAALQPAGGGATVAFLARFAFTAPVPSGSGATTLLLSAGLALAGVALLRRRPSSRSRR